MPAIDLTNPAILNFYSEVFDKEARSRTRWNVTNHKTLEEAAMLKRAPKNYTPYDAIAHQIKTGMAALSQDHKDSSRFRKMTPIRDAKPVTTKDLKHGNSIVDIGYGDPKDDPRLARPDTDPNPDPIMRPVDSKTAKVVYKQRPDFGRVAYLSKRARKLPEDRYYLPECTSWNYGWRLKDAKLAKPQHGRYWHLMWALKNRSGAQPDPSHYSPTEDINDWLPCAEHY